ncbi:unnamed protein product, partial [Scytosiphon promiscuus]
AGAAESESARKGEIGAEPAEYLASSQAGHIRLQSGGTVFADSVGQVDGDGPAREGDEADGGLVHSEALCVSMGATGEKDRAFDFVVPTGRWVHLAIVASSAAEARTTLYVDGAAVDTISMRMSLPMGYVGAGPHAQESSAAATGGGSFVGLLAQTRYWRQARSSGEIQRDLRNDVAGMDGLVGLWGCDEGQGSSLTDWTDNHACCLGRGGTEWVDVPSGAPVGVVRGHGRWELLAAVGLRPDEQALPEVGQREGGMEEDLGSGEASDAEEKVDGGFGWGSEGDGVIEMTGTFTRNAISGVEGIWMRPSTQVVTLRFRRAAAAAAGSGSGGVVRATAVEGSVDWPEEQASAEFTGSIYADPAVSSGPPAAAAAGADPETAAGVLTLEGEVGEVFQGAPERVGWAVGAKIRGTFCKDGTDGTVTGSWSARAAATALEPLEPGGMRLNVGLLPNRLLCAEGNGPGSGTRSAAAAAAGDGSTGDSVMGSSCRTVWVAGGGNDNGFGTPGHGFSALNTGLQPVAGPLIATVEVHPEPPSEGSFPDPITWKTAEDGAAPAGEETPATGKEERDGTADAAAAPSAAADAAAAVGPTASGSGGDTARRLIVAGTPSVEGEGYRTGKWLWEWHVVSCGNQVSFGVCGYDVAAISAAGVPVQGAGGAGAGDRADLWLYRADGKLLHGGESTERACPGGGFDSGDVVGVELDADAGTLAFLKNDSYVGGQFKIVRRSDVAEGDGGAGGDGDGDGVAGESDHGLYPCASLRGSGDAAVLLGLKEGAATITFRSPPSEKKGGGGGRSSPSPPSSSPTPSAGEAASSAAAAKAE